MTNYAEIRRAAGLSQAAFGARAGVCFLTVFRFEKGRKVRARTSAALTRAYDALGQCGRGSGGVDATFRLLSSEEVRLAQEYTATPILGKVVRLPVDSLLTRAFRDALLKHREDCAARRRKCRENDDAI
jgi:transcriptional regulator with XRE-family HTH domain